ncbi:MAG: hypothetical protein ACHREM_24625 [Polyangiales bacterium]
MSVVLPDDRMAEAEVALRLAFHLVGHAQSSGRCRVAIDGAQATVHGAEVFPVSAFLATHGWMQSGQSGKNAWQGHYARGSLQLDVRAQSGLGDVVCVVNGRTVRAECKKGPLVLKKGSPEYPLVREALGQLLTIEEVSEGDLLVVAVPMTDRFRALSTRWTTRPLVKRSGIAIVLVGRTGAVEGLNLE